MPPRTLATLAHALSAAPDLDAALLALGEALAEVDRFAQIALVRYDARREMLVRPARGRRRQRGAQHGSRRRSTTCRRASAIAIAAGGTFVDFADHSDEFAPLFALQPVNDVGWLALRGLRFEGQLSAVIVLYEPRKFFGTRTSERLAPAVGAVRARVRCASSSARRARRRCARSRTSRSGVHGEYERKLATLEQQLLKARGHRSRRTADPERLVALEREAAKALGGRAPRRADAQPRSRRRSPRRSSSSRRRTSSCIAAASRCARRRARSTSSIACSRSTRRRTTRASWWTDCSRSSATTWARSAARSCCARPRSTRSTSPRRAASRPNVPAGAPDPVRRRRRGEGRRNAGAAARAGRRRGQERIRCCSDEYFTTGSFISFPLVYHGELVGVVNLTNRAMHGIFVEEDVERVRLLALVIALVATQCAPPRAPARDAECRLAPVPPLQHAIRQLATGASLSADESRAAFDAVMSGEATPAQIAALLVGLRVKGETPEEVAGAARALRGAMVQPRAPSARSDLVDTCGTGGGAVGDLQHLDRRGAARRRRRRAHREARQPLVHVAVRQRRRARGARRADRRDRRR